MMLTLFFDCGLDANFYTVKALVSLRRQYIVYIRANVAKPNPEMATPRCLAALNLESDQ